MADPIAPKYSLLEIERRWLVDLQLAGPLHFYPARRIEDFYFTGTRLRLRKMEQPDGSVVFKLCKKYGAQNLAGEPITNLYLTAAEFDALRTLPVLRIEKTRYSLPSGVLDVYQFPTAGLAIFEQEFATATAAREYTPPPFVTEEVTHRSEYSGAALAGCV